MNFKSYIPVLAMLAVTASFTACTDDMQDVENRVYDTGALQPTTVLFDDKTDEQNVSFNVSMALPSQEDMTVTFAPDFSLVENYNAIYNASAVQLPAENFELTEPKAVFTPGTIESSNVQLKIKNLLTLDRNIIYVLPLTVVDSSVPVLPSQKTRYIVVRAAAIVNVAANMVKNSATFVDPNSASVLNGLSEMTMQCVFKVDKFGGSDVNIQTLLGIENVWLFRISDAGLPANQLQFVTPGGPLSDASWQLKENQWICLTVTWNAAEGAATLYIDGVKKSTLSNTCHQAVAWGNAKFYIGKSFNDNRWLNGAICEVRVWNRILSDGEIAEKRQPYQVEPDAEGLVAYWKFNEGSGTLIRDYANGNNLQCEEAPKWIDVALPEE